MNEQNLKSKSLLVKFLSVMMCYNAINYAYVTIDTKIESKWRDYPPFSFWEHPHLDFYRSFNEIVQNTGFNVEEHWVTTEDGYINLMHRINTGPYEKKTPKAAVLLVHGLIDSSEK